ncbi:MAG: hypothetical protein ABUK01_18085 [Leptospirales bacterium]
MITRTDLILEALGKLPEHTQTLKKRFAFLRHLDSAAFQKKAENMSVENLAEIIDVDHTELVEFLNLPPEKVNQNIQTLLIAKNRPGGFRYKQGENLKEKSFDVRELVASGVDPFTEIQKIAKTLKKNEYLKIASDFRPAPLLRHMESKGYVYEEEKEGDLFFTYFYFEGLYKKESGFLELAQNRCVKLKNDLHSKNRQSVVELDVRDLAAPEPMEKILATIHGNQNLQMVEVIHRKIPYLLVEPLARQGWGVAVFENGDDILVYAIKENLL